MTTPLQDEVAIVTGGSRGIGRTIAAALLDLVRIDKRGLPALVELRPAKPPKK